MSAYLHAVGGVPVHVGALTDFLRTRAKWLRIDTVRNVSGSGDVCLRVGGPYATPRWRSRQLDTRAISAGSRSARRPPMKPTVTTKEQTHAR